MAVVKPPADVAADTVTRKLTKVEYYIDNDPGFGNATPVAVTSAYNLPDYYISANIGGLAAGDHKLFVRSINAGGNWSYDNVYSFRIVAAVTGTSIVVSNVSPRTLCSGSTIKVSYSAAGSFNSGNQFKVQLSDSAGSFTTPTVLATSTATSDLLTCNVPASLPTGNGYKVRVVSTNPVFQGAPFAYSLNAGTSVDARFNGYANYLVVDFLNSSVYGSAYMWNFGDSVTSYEVSPQHTYARAGDYNVCLIATNACNQKSDTTCKIVSVNGISFTDDDRDGLFDLSENFYGSVIGNFDTNNDGLADGINVFTGTLLLSSDADGDGISNTQEIANGTSPVLSDTDFDGVPDNLDAYPLDRSRSKIPPANGADVTAPVITVNL